jgi:hypothetical protein
MPAFAGMTNYDTVSMGEEHKGEGGLSAKQRRASFGEDGDLRDPAGIPGAASWHP